MRGALWIALAAVLACTGPGAGTPSREDGPQRSSAPRPSASEDPFSALDAMLRSEPPRERCQRILWIEIEKRRRRLTATCDSGQRHEFPVALGRLAFGDKAVTGDLRTPEGFYRVAEPGRPSTFHIFMLLDYPSRDDAERALREGRISERTYARISLAHARGQLPPQDTELGGRIGLHGEGGEHQGMSAVRDWTLGCIALSDEHIEFLAERTPVGTSVQILP
jgi:murein L,D-transpeptidase YafK